MTNKPITREDLLEFKNQLLEELRRVSGTAVSPQKLWLRSCEVRKLLGISSGTLQNLRSNGTLRSSKVGGIIYYNYRDIEKIMNQGF